jgi:hypothetical protein
MLLSICAFDDYDFLSKHDNFENPFEIYEKLCESLTFRRAPRKESKADPDQENNPNQTKITRKMWEQEAKEAFENGRCSWDGLEEAIGSYFADHPIEKGLELQFTKEGIILPPDPTIVIAYPDEKTGILFDPEKDNFSTEEEKEKRFKFIYTLYLYIKEKQKENYGKLKCRCNHVVKCSITVINI